MTIRKPFTEKLGTFAPIACRASKSQIIRPICSSSRQWNNMVNVVLSQLLMTIGTCALLLCENLLNIFLRVRPFGFLLASTPVFPFDPIHHFGFFWIVQPQITHVDSVSSNVLFTMGMIAFLSILSMAFLMSLIVLPIIPTLLTAECKSIFRCFIAMEVIKCCGEYMLALCATFVSILNRRKGDRSNLVAGLTTCFKSRLFCSVNAKVFSRCRELFLAVMASFLRYNVHMEEITFLSSRSRLFQQRGSKHIYLTSSIIPRSRSPSNFIAILHA